MCLDANLTNHLNINTMAAMPVMSYIKEDDKRNCLNIIQEEFIKRYPITARKHDLIQLKQQWGQLLTTFINNLMMLVRIRGRRLGTQAGGLDGKPRNRGRGR